MTAGRKIASEEEARRCFAAAKAARTELGPWARAHDIDGRSLNAWKVNLAKRGVRRRANTARLIELVPRGARVSPSRYVVRVGNVVLELGDDFNEQVVRRLVALLKSC